MALIALVAVPSRPRLALGIVGGGVLAALSYWAIAGFVDQLTGRAKSGENRPVSRGFVLVKFFTRHAILALAAYGMMLRLHLDPAGLLIGVTAVMVAAAAELRRRE